MTRNHFQKCYCKPLNIVKSSDNILLCHCHSKSHVTLTTPSLGTEVIHSLIIMTHSNYLPVEFSQELHLVLSMSL